MKKKIFMACAALVVSAAAVIGVKTYNYSQMSDLALANIEALSDKENYKVETTTCYVDSINGELMTAYKCNDNTKKDVYYPCDETCYFTAGVDSKCVSKVEWY